MLGSQRRQRLRAAFQTVALPFGRPCTGAGDINKALQLGHALELVQFLGTIALSLLREALLLVLRRAVRREASTGLVMANIHGCACAAGARTKHFLHRCWRWRRRWRCCMPRQIGFDALDEHGVVRWVVTNMQLASTSLPIGPRPIKQPVSLRNMEFISTRDIIDHDAALLIRLAATRPAPRHGAPAFVRNTGFHRPMLP